MIWGVDLGSRSLYLAGLDDERPGVLLESVQVAKKPARHLELIALAEWLRAIVTSYDVLFVEEPPNVRNVRTLLQLGEVAGVVLSRGAPAYLVPVSTWKHATVGNGHATKEDVSLWLRDRHSVYSAACGEDQNLVDATCIALYGRGVVDHSHQALATS